LPEAISAWSSAIVASLNLLGAELWFCAAANVHVSRIGTKRVRWAARRGRCIFDGKQASLLIWESQYGEFSNLGGRLHSQPNQQDETRRFLRAADFLCLLWLGVFCFVE
jgi:hypothetical protein